MRAKTVESDFLVRCVTPAATIFPLGCSATPLAQPSWEPIAVMTLPPFPKVGSRTPGDAPAEASADAIGASAKRARPAFTILARFIRAYPGELSLVLVLDLALGDFLHGHGQVILRARLDERRREVLEGALA